MFNRFLIYFALSYITYTADAQMHVSIIGEMNNRVNRDPDAGLLLKSHSIPSLGIALMQYRELQNHWHLKFGLSGEVLRYQLSFSSRDTLSSASGGFFYHEFADLAFCVDMALTSGKGFQLGKTSLALFLGGGITYYFDYATNQKAGLNPAQVLFEYQMRNDNKVVPFAEVSAQINPGGRTILGIRYSHHFKPALTGTYNIYGQDPPNGQLSLTQRTFSLFLEYRLKE